MSRTYVIRAVHPSFMRTMRSPRAGILSQAHNATNPHSSVQLLIQARFGYVAAPHQFGCKDEAEVANYRITKQLASFFGHEQTSGRVAVEPVVVLIIAGTHGERVRSVRAPSTPCNNLTPRDSQQSTIAPT
eukprot:954794-Prymnesium_polylepis.1